MNNWSVMEWRAALANSSLSRFGATRRGLDFKNDLNLFGISFFSFVSDLNSIEASMTCVVCVVIFYLCGYFLRFALW